MSTQLTEHAKTILRAIADGKTIQRFIFERDLWTNLTTKEALAWLTATSIPELRIAPETRSINSVVFAAPVQKSNGDYAVSVSCAGEPTTQKWFKSLEDCKSAFNAIIDALEGKTK